MKWQFTLPLSLLAMSLFDEKSIFRELVIIVFFLMSAISSAIANTPLSNTTYACTDLNSNDAHW